jgi:hypothetical protein
LQRRATILYNLAGVVYIRGVFGGSLHVEWGREVWQLALVSVIPVMVWNLDKTGFWLEQEMTNIVTDI